MPRSFPVPAGVTELTPRDVLPSTLAFNSNNTQNLTTETARTDYYIWGVGAPGPTGFNHMPGGRSDNPIRFRTGRGFLPRDPDDPPIIEGPAIPPEEVTGAFFTFPAMQGYGVGNPVYVATQSAGENPIAELSVIAAATAPEPQVIAYEFVAPENGFTFFEIVESLIDDTEFTVTAGDTELPISEGGAIDFLAALGGPVESFFISGFDDDLSGDDPLPLVTGIQFASAGVVDLQIISIGVPEPNTLALIAIGLCFLGRGWQRQS